MKIVEIDTSDVAILSRVIAPDKPTLSHEAANAILALDFTARDKQRMRELSAKARQGTLTRDEKLAIDNYERVGHVINIMQSKARRSLKTRRGTNGSSKSS